jgi:HAD superfamily hydrolase (TIGR01509 family)
VLRGDDTLTRVRAVVFDYGHTLLDFATAEDRLLDAYEEVRRMLEAQAYRDVPDAPALVDGLSRRVQAMVVQSYERRELEELDIVALFEVALLALDVRLPRDLVRGIAELEHRALVSALVMPATNLQVLRDLRALGLQLGIVSNAHFLPKLMREDIRRLGIADLVDDAVFSAEIGVRKPHPAIFRKVLGELGVVAEEAIFVGDRLRDDISGAKSLGMRGVLTHEFRQEDVEPEIAVPDLVIDRLPELVPFVRSLAAG